jgi:hypothetical protein
MRTRRNNDFTTVRVEGAILPADILKRVSDGDASLGGLDENSYHLTSGEKINEAVSHSWNRLLGSWANYKGAVAKLPEGSPATTETRERWLLPLFQELGYGRLVASRKAVDIAGKAYPISHFWNNVPIHLVGSGVSIDKAQARVPGAARTSPHGLVQEFLNRSGDYLWAFISNGKRLRILRDNSDLVRQAFVEFDLESMMEGEVYSDFVLLWLLCHQSRVEAEKPIEFWLEKWSHAAQEQGVRALDDLRKGVEAAITALGRGFLAHPANGALREMLRAGVLDKQDYYRQLLRLAYRLIFLFAAEDRELLLDPEADEKAKDRYTKFYSTAKLRRLAARRYGTRHGDLFTALKLVMDKLGDDNGCPELGLPALGSFLFSPKAMSDLDDCAIGNRDLLEAVRALAFITDKGVRRQVDYKNLGSREMGSIYESLLELHPEVNVGGAAFSLSTTGGNERKTSGSYYTPSSLISSLLDTALEPVLDEACKKPNPEAAILALKVCDPACGSGHFLIDAAHRMAKRLATTRTGDAEPSPEAIRHALRDVVGRCLYGIDINPMSVELCKFTLWMDALEPGRPLSFLDHHIQVGNSLLGTTPALIKAGIPDEAFIPIEGDDRAFCTELKLKNRRERETGQYELFDPSGQPLIKIGNLASTLMDMLHIDDSTVTGIKTRQERWNGLVQSSDYRVNRLLADAWCAAFVWKKTQATDRLYPITEDVFRQIEANPFVFEGTAIEQEILRLANQYRFFHFHLVFSDVFHKTGDGNPVDNNHTGWSGGFDVVLGNPPWERVKLQEKEWFAVERPDIANAPNAAARGQMIRTLEEEDPVVYNEFVEARRKADGESHFLRNSGRYPLCGRGDINTYAVFAEGMRLIINSNGRVGCIVPSGIATDDTTKFYFQNLMETRSLSSLYDFENREGIFPGVHRSYKFCLLTVMGLGRPHNRGAEFMFFALSPSDLNDNERRFSLSAEDIALLNPNSHTCPVFRLSRDAEITKAVYRRVPIFVNESKGSEGNPWEVEIGRMFHTADDSPLFCAEQSDETLRLYEAKCYWQFDHRYATFVGDDYEEVCEEEKINPSFMIRVRYNIERSKIPTKFLRRLAPWYLSFRKIARATDARTLILSITPESGLLDSGNNIYIRSAHNAAYILTTLNSLPVDYIARQKIGGPNMTVGVLSQLPLLPASAFAEKCPWVNSSLKTIERPITTADWVITRAIELTYTASDLTTFAHESGFEGLPFQWNEERRFLLRCELDAAFFYLYGMSRGDLDYIMETFQIVKRKDEQRFGEYRTKRLVLGIYDEMVQAAETGSTYQTRLSPPPADPSVRHSA